MLALSPKVERVIWEKAPYMVLEYSFPIKTIDQRLIITIITIIKVLIRGARWLSG